MEYYAKIIDKKTKRCDVGLGSNVEYYQSVGMKIMDVSQGFDGEWYVTGYEPQKTKEDVREERVAYRQEHIDNQTLERQRKQANGTWTQEDEEAYLALDAEVTAYIEEHFPYPEEE